MLVLAWSGDLLSPGRAPAQTLGKLIEHNLVFSFPDRGKDLKEQHEQKVCEREMQRITLPLSAFTNPTCEIMDEKTIVVHSNQTPADPQEGSTLLVSQAGTPGA